MSKKTSAEFFPSVLNFIQKLNWKIYRKICKKSTPNIQKNLKNLFRKLSEELSENLSGKLYLVKTFPWDLHWCCPWVVRWANDTRHLCLSRSTQHRIEFFFRQLLIKLSFWQAGVPPIITICLLSVRLGNRQSHELGNAHRNHLIL